MRQPTLDEAARIIDAGDALADCLREVTNIARSRKIGPEWWDVSTRLLDAWRDATRQVAP